LALNIAKLSPKLYKQLNNDKESLRIQNWIQDLINELE